MSIAGVRPSGPVSPSFLKVLRSSRTSLGSIPDTWKVLLTLRRPSNPATGSV